MPSGSSDTIFAFTAMAFSIRVCMRDNMHPLPFHHDGRWYPEPVRSCMLPCHFEQHGDFDASFERNHRSTPVLRRVQTFSWNSS